MDSSEPAWCALQHMKFKEAVEQWRKMKKGKIQIIREDATTKTKKPLRCSCPYHRKMYSVSGAFERNTLKPTGSDDKCIYVTKNPSSSPWKRMYDTYYSAWYWHNNVTGESQWEKVRGQCPS